MHLIIALKSGAVHDLLLNSPVDGNYGRNNLQYKDLYILHTSKRNSGTEPAS